LPRRRRLSHAPKKLGSSFSERQKIEVCFIFTRFLANRHSPFADSDHRMSLPARQNRAKQRRSLARFRLCGKHERTLCVTFGDLRACESERRKTIYAVKKTHEDKDRQRESSGSKLNRSTKTGHWCQKTDISLRLVSSERERGQSDTHDLPSPRRRDDCPDEGRQTSIQIQPMTKSNTLKPKTVQVPLNGWEHHCLERLRQSEQTGTETQAEFLRLLLWREISRRITRRQLHSWEWQTAARIGRPKKPITT